MVDLVSDNRVSNMLHPPQRMEEPRQFRLITYRLMSQKVAQDALACGPAVHVIHALLMAAAGSPLSFLSYIPVVCVGDYFVGAAKDNQSIKGPPQVPRDLPKDGSRGVRLSRPSASRQHRGAGLPGQVENVASVYLASCHSRWPH